MTKTANTPKGDSAKSKIQLEKALKLDGKFPGAEEAKSILSKM